LNFFCVNFGGHGPRCPLVKYEAIWSELIATKPLLHSSKSDVIGMNNFMVSNRVELKFCADFHSLWASNCHSKAFRLYTDHWFYEQVTTQKRP
jgi:hypothetical protein